MYLVPCMLPVTIMTCSLEGLNEISSWASVRIACGFALPHRKQVKLQRLRAASWKEPNATVVNNKPQLLQWCQKTDKP